MKIGSQGIGATCAAFVWAGWLILTPLQAQITNGGITGRIVDEQGRKLPHAVVTLRNSDTGLVRTATSDDDGRFEFLGLPPAAYVAQATHAENGAAPRTLVVNLGQRTPLIIEMKPGGGLQEYVTAGHRDAGHSRRADFFQRDPVTGPNRNAHADHHQRRSG